jgi:hypothetical protein
MNSSTLEPSAREIAATREPLTLRLRNRKITQAVLFTWQILGLAAVIAFASAGDHSANKTWCRPVVIASLLAGGAMFAGFIVGFLFGIPKSRSDSAASVSTHMSATSLQTNTNLEQISDWLTKILVGVGLAQISEISAGLWRLARLLGPAFGGAPETTEPFVVTLLVYFTLCGFLSGYFWTRMFLAGAFSLADQELEFFRNDAEGPDHVTVSVEPGSTGGAAA